MPVEPKFDLPSSSDPPAAAKDLMVGGSPILIDVACHKCAYNLKGLTGDHCPECGSDITWVKWNQSRIAWLRRKDLGVFRAYWRTVYFVMRHPNRLGDEIVREVPYRDANLFRWVTVVHLFVPIAGLLGWLLSHVPKPSQDANMVFALFPTAPFWGNFSLMEGFLRELYWIGHSIGPAIAFYVFLFLSIAGFSGVPMYFMWDRSQSVEYQNRSIALGHFALAPLSLFGWSVLLFVVWLGDSSRVLEVSSPIIAFLSGVIFLLPLGILLLTWNSLRLFRMAVLPYGWWRAFGMWLIPLVGFFWGVLTIFAFQVILIYCAALIDVIVR